MSRRGRRRTRAPTASGIVHIGGFYTRSALRPRSVKGNHLDAPRCEIQPLTLPATVELNKPQTADQSRRMFHQQDAQKCESASDVH